MIAVLSSRHLAESTQKEITTMTDTNHIIRCKLSAALLAINPSTTEDLQQLTYEERYGIAIILSEALQMLEV